MYPITVAFVSIYRVAQNTLEHFIVIFTMFIAHTWKAGVESHLSADCSDGGKSFPRP